MSSWQRRDGLRVSGVDTQNATTIDAAARRQTDISLHESFISAVKQIVVVEPLW